jgi:DNA-binding CsgD family transcriptional regulator
VFVFLSLGREPWFSNIYGAEIYFHRLILEIVAVFWAYGYYRIMRKLSGKLPWGAYIPMVVTVPAIAEVLELFGSNINSVGAVPAFVYVFMAITSALFVAVIAILFAVYINMRTAYEARLFAEQIVSTPPVWTKEAGLSEAFIAKYSITLRETEVIGLVLQGKTNKEIAIALGFTEDTAKKHTKNIYGKVGVSGRFALQALLRG